jgi:hypothetical protein
MFELQFQKLLFDQLLIEELPIDDLVDLSAEPNQAM